ncbi:MAG: hypothetical protein ACT4QA_13330 [Panacagrimonas sp.]
MSSFPFRLSALSAALAALAPLTASAADPIGSEFRLNNATPAALFSTSVAIDADGDFVAVWTQGSEQNIGGISVIARRFDAGGKPLTAELRVDLGPGLKAYPAVASEADGDFVVVWAGSDCQTLTDCAPNSLGGGILARRFTAAGVALSGEVPVNTTTPGTQTKPRVAVDVEGNYAVTWESRDGQDGSSYGIYTRAFVASGTQPTPETRVNVSTAGRQLGPSIAMDGDGDFVVSWVGPNASGGDDVFARLFDRQARPKAGEIKVNQIPADSSSGTSVAMAPGGRSVVAWDRNSSVSSQEYEISATRLSENGTPMGLPNSFGATEMNVNNYTPGAQQIAAVSMDAFNNFVVVWTSSVRPGDPEYGVYARRYNSLGASFSNDIRVNTTTAGTQYFGSVAMDADGDFVVVWNGVRNNSSAAADIMARRYRGPQNVDLDINQVGGNVDVPGQALDNQRFRSSVVNLHPVSGQTGFPAFDRAIGAARNVQIVDTLPVGATFLSIAGSNWDCTGITPVTQRICRYTLPLQASGLQTEALNLLVRRPTRGRVVNQVRTSADPIDPILLNNTETDIVEVP